MKFTTIHRIPGSMDKSIIRVQKHKNGPVLYEGPRWYWRDVVSKQYKKDK